MTPIPMASPGCDPLHRHRHPHHHHHHHHHCHHHHLLHHHHHRHHHCHHRFSPCTLHSHPIHCRRQVFHNVTPLSQNSESFVPFPIGNNSYGEAAEDQEADSSAQTSQEPEHLDLDEEEDEPVFVLTDEWREFFAKSEARRRQEKKQRKKGKK